MIITLPKDLVQIEKTHKSYKKRFGFNRENNRMIMPRDLINLFDSTTYGVDIWVSRKEKSVYLKFVPKDKAYFSFSNSNGYVGCADLFRWLSDQEVPVFDDYEYTDYQIDKKNKIVKVNLERK